MLDQSRFAIQPSNVKIQRSVFDRSHNVKTTFNAGDLVPIYIDEILPGDTFDLRTSLLCRMSTPIVPVMDSAYLDYFFFFVPTRLVWEHSEQFFGQSDSAWSPQVTYQVPTSNQGTSYATSGSLADYMGLPLGVGLAVNTLPFRAYQLIWDQWFRDENLQTPVLHETGDTTVWGNVNVLRKANKIHDYFTSALPEPQKGPSVTIPAAGTSPVMTVATNHGSPYDLVWVDSAGNPLTGSASRAMSISTTGTQVFGNWGTAPATQGTARPGNLEVVNDNAATINQLRQAFAVQRLLERDARGGTRYTEIIRAHFGVTSSDARLQRPEYLGGARINLNMEQVLQTSSTDTTTPQGNTAAYSKTGDARASFTKSFTEHGYLIGVACVRTRHSYQQGINRMWYRKNRYDFYWPALANLGEQGIKKGEIYAVGNSTDTQIFGYQEAWAEYRYKPDQITGAFRHNAGAGTGTTMDEWHYADWYASAPSLSSTWIQEDKANVDRTLAVTSTLANQFLLDVYFKIKCWRPMPTYSIPGLVDHF